MILERNLTRFEKKKKQKKTKDFPISKKEKNRMVLKIYTVAKIFFAPSNDKKVWKKKKYTIQYAILILLLHYSKYIYIYIHINIYKKLSYH